jgi:hypothetical protein
MAEQITTEQITTEQKNEQRHFPSAFASPTPA